MLASLLSSIAKGLNQMPTCKIDSFYCFKKWHNKIPVGQLGALPPQRFCCGGNCLHELASVVTSGCLTCKLLYTCGHCPYRVAVYGCCFLQLVVHSGLPVLMRSVCYCLFSVLYLW